MIAMQDEETRAARRRKLSFRAWRRGFKEADIILGHFSDEALPAMSDTDMDVFEVLLEVPDQDLYGWIIERDPTPAPYQSDIMKQLNVFYKTAYKKI